ncbi:MAG: ABC transporter permease subunit [Cardiobacteriaceae bacterium]|nr:ABC transporter permease subunit [Cardiobacteriaceae bacterium]
MKKILIQSALVAILGIIGWFIVHNTSINMASRGLSLSFDFMNHPAGFAVSQSLIDFNESHSYGRVFVVGLLNTLLVSILSIGLATVVGVSVGVARVSPNWLIRQLARSFVEIFRNIPLLLQLFFWYFAVLAVLPPPKQSALMWGCSDLGCLVMLNNRGLSLATLQGSVSEALWILILMGIPLSIACHYAQKFVQRVSGKQWKLVWFMVGLWLLLPIVVFFAFVSPESMNMPKLQGFNIKGGITLLPELLALWLALSLYSAAYIAEYVRSGLNAVPKGQYEAAQALGLSRAQGLKLIVLPQALRVIIPPLTNQYLNVVKNSSLATAIAYPDLVSVFTGTALNQTGRALEIISLTMLVYLSTSLFISLTMNLYNRKIRLQER